MDVAADDSGFFLLVWPYNGPEGVPVVKFDLSGRMTARWRCHIPPECKAQLHLITSQPGSILLASADGDVIKYKL